MTPVPLALIENSIGVSGSTLSLTTLVKRLDRRRFAPHIVVARPEQEAYLRARLDPAIPITRIGKRAGVKAAGWARRGRLLPRVAALLDLLLVTLPYALALRRFLRQHRIELVHQNNGFDIAAVPLCWAMRLPLVAYQRGNEWHSRLVRRLAPLASCYVANSGATRDDLVALGVPPALISVVYPPVDLQDFDTTASGAPPSRAAHGVPADAPCFGILGKLQGWKGQTVFLRAARRVLDAQPDARAWIVGDAPAGEEAFAAELRGLARALGIADRVVFTGFVADVPGVLRCLDVVVHASVAPEPFGRVIVEAMMMGRPVVATDAGGPREIIEDGRTGLLVPRGDEASLANAIGRLLGDRALADAMGEAGRREATRRFSAAEHALTMQSVYDRVLVARARPSPTGNVQPSPSGAPQKGGH
ncbi:MAG TPA: glycosyltransferase [Methylomirabilota bacterium]|nr:glycosyltransferase [Methylomirabilota bacterium]